jgi:hypothetical protein
LSCVLFEESRDISNICQTRHKTQDRL